MIAERCQSEDVESFRDTIHTIVDQLEVGDGATWFSEEPLAVCAPGTGLHSRLCSTLPMQPSDQTHAQAGQAGGGREADGVCCRLPRRTCDGPAPCAATRRWPRACCSS